MPTPAPINSSDPPEHDELVLRARGCTACPLYRNATQTVFGEGPFRVTRQRGMVISSEGLPPTLATVHPSSLLRMPDKTTRDQEIARLVGDLRVAVDWLEGRIAAASGRARHGAPR